MPPKPQAATDAELAILRLLWEQGQLTASEIRRVLYPQGTPSDQGTVQKLLQRLEAKDLISRDRSQFAHVFQAEVSQQALIGQQLETLAEKLTDGSMAPLIMHAVANKKLTAAERKAIQKLLKGGK